MAVVGPFEKNVGYTGLSTDTKPSTDVKDGARFYETDTGLWYIYTGSAWTEVGEDYGS